MPGRFALSMTSKCGKMLVHTMVVVVVRRRRKNVKAININLYITSCSHL
jgi:hypothetical protein